MKNYYFCSTENSLMKERFKNMMEWVGAYSVVSVAIFLPFIGLSLFCLAMFALAVGLGLL